MRELLEKLEQEIQNRGILEENISNVLQDHPAITNRRIIFGYASVDAVDRENQRIPIYALKEAVKRFMSNIYYRPVTVFHSDCMVGRILPSWTNPETGETLRTEVDNIGWKIISEIRDDIDLANKVWDEILKGTIRSFSIAGSSKDKLQKQENGIHYEQVNQLDIMECAICEIPVNPMSKFDILWDPHRVQI